MRHAGQELRRLAVEELIKRHEVRLFATRVFCANASWARLAGHRLDSRGRL